MIFRGKAILCTHEGSCHGDWDFNEFSARPFASVIDVILLKWERVATHFCFQQCSSLRARNLQKQRLHPSYCSKILQFDCHNLGGEGSYVETAGKFAAWILHGN